MVSIPTPKASKEALAYDQPQQTSSVHGGCESLGNHAGSPEFVESDPPCLGKTLECHQQSECRTTEFNLDSSAGAALSRLRGNRVFQIGRAFGNAAWVLYDVQPVLLLLVLLLLLLLLLLLYYSYSYSYY